MRTARIRESGPAYDHVVSRLVDRRRVLDVKEPHIQACPLAATGRQLLMAGLTFGSPWPDDCAPLTWPREGHVERMRRNHRMRRRRESAHSDRLRRFERACAQSSETHACARGSAHRLHRRPAATHTTEESHAASQLQPRSASRRSSRPQRDRSRCPAQDASREGALHGCTVGHG